MTSWRKVLTHQMKGRRFTGSDPITVLQFPHYLKKKCGVNLIHEGVAMCLMYSLLSGAAKESLTSRMSHIPLGSSI